MMTYNGARYLDLQIESLLLQEQVTIKLLVCDDGSTDQTLEILDKWKGRGKIDRIIHSNRVGPTVGFQNLIKLCPEAKFVAFCDQDDIWDPQKLKIQIGLFEENIPTLVCSARNYIDENGDIKFKALNQIGFPRFENALVENLAPGNTQVLNRKAIELVIHHTNMNIAHYDSWIYLVLSAYGKCIYVQSPLTNYRIHANNLVGVRKLFSGNMYRSISVYKEQAAQFKSHAESSLSPPKHLYLDSFLTIFEKSRKAARVNKILKLKIYRSSQKDAWAMKFFILLGVIFGIM